MKYTVIAISLAISFLTPAFVNAAEVSAAERKKVQQSLDQISKVAGKPLKADAISTTPVPGLLQVTSDYSIFYVSTDGKYVVSGEMIDVAKDPKEWSMTEQEMRKVRKAAVATLKTKDMIIYPATATKIGSVYVFTDIDCHFCRKLQESIKDYTDKGIEVRYLAYPRAGLTSKSFEKSVSVWCAADKNKAYTAAVEGKDIPDNQCKDNPVKSDFELGLKLAVRGTPTFIFEDGRKVAGLISPEDAVKIIKNET
jgi:thiol:disulfide interchange protein DsbC